VEGRKTADWLSRCGLDLSHLENLNRMATPRSPAVLPSEPYRAYAVSVPETFGRVAAEALANGLPVLASDRGALPRPSGSWLDLHTAAVLSPLGGVPGS